MSEARTYRVARIVPFNLTECQLHSQADTCKKKQNQYTNVCVLLIFEIKVIVNLFE
jgi:hypothetical protein